MTPRDWPLKHIEPHRVWVHEGIDCAITFHDRYGFFNGYVRVPEDHLWLTMDMDLPDLEVPGDLTFADRSGWIGFDTSHAQDVWPMDELVAAGVPISERLLRWREWQESVQLPAVWQIVWSMDKLVREVENLAHQVAVTRDLWRVEEPADVEQESE